MSELGGGSSLRISLPALLEWLSTAMSDTDSCFCGHVDSVNNDPRYQLLVW